MIREQRSKEKIIKGVDIEGTCSFYYFVNEKAFCGIIASHLLFAITDEVMVSIKNKASR